MNARTAIVTHLTHDYLEPVRDPVWKSIFLSSPFLRLLGLAPFQKLNGVRQLGPTYLVYPGATHTRLSHSLGVFHLARRMLISLFSRDRVKGSGRRQGIPEEAADLEGVKAFLCAALFHDLGHYPYAHSLKDLDVESHEDLTAGIIQGKEVGGLIQRELGVDPERVAAIVAPGSFPAADAGVQWFRRILSGALDPDKLDYLNRDAYFCGVPYGVQDVDFLLDEIFADPASGLIVSNKGRAAVESLLFSKYMMYRHVYWHKTVRVATAMIKKAVRLALSQGALEPDLLYGLDDRGLSDLTRSRSFPPFNLVQRVEERRLFKTLVRTPFSEDNPHHARLERLPERTAFEAELAREASKKLGRAVPPEAILIDIPEHISFEIDVPVLDLDGEESLPFSKSNSVFDGRVVRGFAETLRTVALICDRDEELIAALQGIGLKRIVEEGWT